MPVRVLTLNLWHDSGPWAERAARIRATIEELAPDLIGFQEVLRGPGVDLVAQLVQDLGYAVEFVRATDFWRGEGIAFGNAVASRWPVTAREELRLPDAGDGETRAALSVTVDAPVGPIAFTCTHLHWKLHHGWVRERQVVALCDHVRGRRPRGGFPPILVGDFNAEPDSSEIRYVTGLQTLDGRSMHFVDGWRMVAPTEPGFTWSNRNDFARPWLEPDRRIDYVFVGPPRRDGLGKVERCALVGDRPRDGVWLSDHFGLLAELRSEPLPEER